jgi:hypothetical protein
VPSFREGKIVRVQAWLPAWADAGRGAALHLLQRFHQRPAAAGAVSHPVATNPGAGLARIAASAAGPSSSCSHDQEVHQATASGRATRRRAPAAAAEARDPRDPAGRARRGAAAEHRIDPKLLDANAVRVVRTLKDAGYEAYIVGGAVRDLLVGLRPKDFDVATDATPEQVKSLFRRAFIIGRRFRLVHVVFGRGREHETIEVSTFRAYLDAAAAEQVAGNEKTSKPRSRMADKKHVVDASGRVLRDNVWGPQIEDAARRDFTINAMYYDPVTQTVVDYHGGLADVRAACCA